MALDGVGTEREGGVTELASGIDALYLSIKAAVPMPLLEKLALLRETAQELSAPIGFEFGGQDFDIHPGGLGKYKYWLSHPRGEIGITTSRNLPSVRVQPRAEMLHGVGPQATVDWYRSMLESEMGELRLGITRLDLHADLQGWQLCGDDRDRFTSRARSLDLHEVDGKFTGFEFGGRSSGTVMARIYDKTVEIAKKGTAFWEDIWGSLYDPSLPVLRTEFEINKQALNQYGITDPYEAVEAAPRIWVDLTTNWLNYHSVSADKTMSRRPIAPEWFAIQAATFASGAHGLERITEGRQRGDVKLITPRLAGELSSLAASTGAVTLSEALLRAERAIRSYELRSGVSFEEKVATKAREKAFR